MTDDHGDPISYQALQRGTPIFSSDDRQLGTVERAIDNPKEHIFDGIVMIAGDRHVWVDAPEVARITERRVTLTIDAAGGRRANGLRAGSPRVQRQRARRAAQPLLRGRLEAALTRGAGRPAAAVAHSSASQVSAASATWTQTISAGPSSAYWIPPTAPWAAIRTAATATGALHVGGRTAAAQQDEDGDDRDAEHGREPPVLVDRPVERAEPLPLQAVDRVARPGAAGVRPRRGRGGAEEDRERAEREQGAHRPHARAVEHARPLARLVARAPGQRDGGHEDQHRERVVAHDEAGREVVADREAAEHGLADDAQRQQHADPREVAAERPPPERQRARRDGGEPDEAGDQPVAVLDPGVRLERRRDAAVALGPVRAAEPGAGQADRRAREDDQRQRDERDLGDALVGAGGERREPAATCEAEG